MYDTALEALRTTELGSPIACGARWLAPLLLAGAFTLSGAAARHAEVTPVPVTGDPAHVAPAPDEPLETLRWLDAARQTIVRSEPSPRRAYEALAELARAQRAAVERAVRAPGATRATIRGAVAGASADALGAAFPTSAASLAAELAAEREAIGPTRRGAFVAGVALGRAARARVPLAAPELTLATVADSPSAARWSVWVADEISRSSSGELAASRALTLAAAAALNAVGGHETSPRRLASR